MRIYNKSQLPRTDPRDAQHRAYSVVQCTQTSVATVACRTKLITLAKVNVPSQNVFLNRVSDKVPERSTLIFGDTRILQHLPR